MRSKTPSNFRSWVNRLAVAVVSVVVCLVPMAALAGATGQAGDDAARLVRQLGAPTFAARQRASRQLRAMGIDAKEALAAAVNDPDAELRSRARTILADVIDADFRARLEAFSADYDGSRHHTLPGWERFQDLFGDSHRARQFFVEIARAEPQLTEVYAADGNLAAETIKARCDVIFADFTRTLGQEENLTLGTMAALLLVGSREDVALEERIAAQLYTWMLYQPVFSDSVRSGPWSAMMKKLLGMWIVKDAGTGATLQNLIFAASYDLAPQGLALATKVLRNEPASAQLRQFALLAIGRFGDQENLPLVEKYLGDSNTCGTIQLSTPPRQVDIQLRDVALAVAVHLAGQDVDGYGAATVQSSPYTYFKVPTLAFADAAKRDAALRRWAEFRSRPSRQK